MAPGCSAQDSIVPDADADAQRAAAKRRLYDQEIALHAAHQTGSAQWISQAEAQLHSAINAYESVRAS